MVSVAVSMLMLICFDVYLLCINGPHDFFFPSHVVWESPGRGAVDEDDRGGFSEHELLDIMYNTCNPSNTGTQVHAHLNKTGFSSHTSFVALFPASLPSPGEVLASTIVHYLQSMTAQSPGQDRVASLRRLLDPDCQDRHVSRETFHSCMREWITQCSQDRWNNVVHMSTTSYHIYST